MIECEKPRKPFKDMTPFQWHGEGSGTRRGRVWRPSIFWVRLTPCSLCVFNQLLPINWVRPNLRRHDEFPYGKKEKNLVQLGSKQSLHLSPTHFVLSYSGCTFVFCVFVRLDSLLSFLSLVLLWQTCEPKSTRFFSLKGPEIYVTQLFRNHEFHQTQPKDGECYVSD